MALLTGSAAATGPVTTITTAGRVVAISADGGRVATDVTLKNGARICDTVSVWQPTGNRITHIGAPTCKTSDSNDENVDSLTIAGNRVT